MMKKLVLFFLITILLTSLSYNLEYDLDVSFDEDKTLFLGTPFSFDVLITVPPDYEVNYVDDDTLNVFIVINKDKKINQTEKHNYVHYNLILAGFDTGEHDLPPISFSIYGIEGSDIHEKIIKTPQYFFNIYSTITDTSFVIKDIVPPIRLRYGLLFYLLLILILIVLIGLIFLFVKRFVAKKKNVIETVKKDSRPSYVKALEMLEILKQKKLLYNRDFLNLYFELSLILRFFIEDYYQFKAVEMTTYEIENFLKNFDISHKKEIITFLKYSDRVKFSKFIPEYTKAEKDLEWLENFLVAFEKREFQTKNDDGAL